MLVCACVCCLVRLGAESPVDSGGEPLIRRQARLGSRLDHPSPQSILGVVPRPPGGAARLPSRYPPPPSQEEENRGDPAGGARASRAPEVVVAAIAAAWSVGRGRVRRPSPAPGPRVCGIGESRASGIGPFQIVGGG